MGTSLTPAGPPALPGAKPTDIMAPRRALRAAYASRMSPDRVATLEEEINEDRYDLSSEMAMYRESVATLVSIEERIRAKHPGRDDLVLEVQSQRNEVVASMARTMRIAREIETSGQVFTNEKVAGLIDKIAGIVMYHITNEQERARVLGDMSDLAAAFTKRGVEGTLVTPDQDVLMMDGTVPGMVGEPPDADEFADTISIPAVGDEM